ncbi:MAG: hypothetical protein ABIH86_06135 [Planctomycetota bacterium]
MTLLSEILFLALLIVAGTAAGVAMNNAFGLAIWLAIPIGWLIVWCAAFAFWAVLLFFVDYFIEGRRSRQPVHNEPDNEPSE